MHFRYSDIIENGCNKTLDDFFPTKKARGARWEVVHGQLGISLAFSQIDDGGGNFTTVLGVTYVFKINSMDRNCMIFFSIFACQTRRDLSILPLALPQ